MQPSPVHATLHGTRMLELDELKRPGVKDILLRSDNSKRIIPILNKALDIHPIKSTACVIETELDGLRTVTKILQQQYIVIASEIRWCMHAWHFS